MYLCCVPIIKELDMNFDWNYFEIILLHKRCRFGSDNVIGTYEYLSRIADSYIIFDQLL